MDYAELVKSLRNGEEWATKDGGIPAGLIYRLSQAADAIEELQQVAAHYEEESKGWWLAACDLKEEREKLQEAVPKWIPVTERLPLYEPLGDLYLCYHATGKHDQIRWIDINWWDGSKFVFKKSGKRDHITHWKPLPEPPEPPKEETEWLN